MFPGRGAKLGGFLGPTPAETSKLGVLKPACQSTKHTDQSNRQTQCDTTNCQTGGKSNQNRLLTVNNATDKK